MSVLLLPPDTAIAVRMISHVILREGSLNIYMSNGEEIVARYDTQDDLRTAWVAICQTMEAL